MGTVGSQCQGGVVKSVEGVVVVEGNSVGFHWRWGIGDMGGGGKPPLPQTIKAIDNTAGRKKRKTNKNPPKDKTGAPNTNLRCTSLSRPCKLHFYCHFHGWVTTHGWPSGHGGHHSDACKFMKSRLSKFTPAMLAARTPDAFSNHLGSTNVQHAANVSTHPHCLSYTTSPSCPFNPFP